MSGVTRRKFLAQVSLGAAAAGGLAGGLVGLVAAPRLPGLPGRTRKASATRVGGNDQESVVAHVRDIATGEVAVMVGTRELVYRDPDLVAHLMGVAPHAVRR